MSSVIATATRAPFGLGTGLWIMTSRARQDHVCGLFADHDRRCIGVGPDQSLAMLILSGRYIGYLPAHYAESWVRNGQMRPILPDQMSYIDTFYLAHLASEKNRAMSTLFDCVRSHIGSSAMPRY